MIETVDVAGLKQEYLTPNAYSRPQKSLEQVKAIVMHWVANPKTTAQMNRNYFNNRADGRFGYGSAHFIVDKTEIIQCIPLNEMAYHVGAFEYTRFARTFLSEYPNNCTIGIELCHEDWDGNFANETIDNATRLVIALLKVFNLSAFHIIRHYDVTKKICPKLWVREPDKFTYFKWFIDKQINNK